MATSELRADLQEILIDNIRETEYPSGQLMDWFEAVVHDLDAAREYVEVLLTKVQSRYPSLQLLRRISAMIDRIETAEMLQQQYEAAQS